MQPKANLSIAIAYFLSNVPQLNFLQTRDFALENLLSLSDFDPIRLHQQPSIMYVFVCVYVYYYILYLYTIMYSIIIGRPHRTIICGPMSDSS